MRILIAHNRYQQMGGEDVVFDTEAQSLEDAGHDVYRFEVNNASIQGLAGKVRAAVSISHNSAMVARFRQAIDAFRPDIVHVHNFFPLLTPGALAASAERGVPTIQTLHNYRSLCANSMFFREGKVCESCISGSYLKGVQHACYRGSAVGSFAVGRMGQSLRQKAREFPAHITFIALTQFSKGRYVQGGFDPAQIVVKANALGDPGAGFNDRKRQILFVGRLSHEKGADLLCRIAKDVDAEFVIAGTGPEYEMLLRDAPANVKLLGSVPREQIFAHMRESMAVAVPSRWYEACPMTVLEAYATATPVIASNLGSLAELIGNGTTGLLAAPDDEADWKRAVNAILDEPEYARRMGHNARDLYLARFTEKVNLERLLDIYSAAADLRRSLASPPGWRLPAVTAAQLSTEWGCYVSGDRACRPTGRARPPNDP
jgi:glycosyltransferase involved in cell wall biosynthesis